MSAFQTLMDGYHRFRRNAYSRHRSDWEELGTGQQPGVMIIACADSRVDPAIVFDLDPGQAFMVRNVANLVPPYDPASGHQGVCSAIEYGVTGLGVQHIVVMGHASCGGIGAALAGGDLGEPGDTFVDQWMALVAEPREAVLADDSCADKQRGLEEASIANSIKNLRTYPYIAEKEAAGELSLHGCHFDIGKGALTLLDEESGEFRPD